MISSKFKNVIKKIIQANYDFNKFDLNIKNGVYLRFDVDVSINNALLISKYLKKKIYMEIFFSNPIMKFIIFLIHAIKR